MIKVAVFDSNLTVVSKDQLNTGSENYYQVAFVFNETWDNFSKYAVFYQVANQPKIEAELTEENENHEFIVNLPNELLVADIPIQVGAYGVDNNDTIISTNFYTLPVVEGAFGDNLISYENASASIVRSTDTKIRLIRENEDGEFEYSTDGETWVVVSARRDYEEVFARLEEIEQQLDDVSEEVTQIVEQSIEPIQQDLSNLQSIVATGYGRLDTGQNTGETVTTLNSLEGRYIRYFFKSSFQYNAELSQLKGKSIWSYTIHSLYHQLSAPYVQSFIISSMIENNDNVIISQETQGTFGDYTDNQGNITIYVDYDLSTLKVYSGRIILKGEVISNG